MDELLFLPAVLEICPEPRDAILIRRAQHGLAADLNAGNMIAQIPSLIFEDEGGVSVVCWASSFSSTLETKLRHYHTLQWKKNEKRGHEESVCPSFWRAELLRM